MYWKLITPFLVKKDCFHKKRKKKKQVLLPHLGILRKSLVQNRGNTKFTGWGMLRKKWHLDERRPSYMRKEDRKRVLLLALLLVNTRINHRNTCIESSSILSGNNNTTANWVATILMLKLFSELSCPHYAASMICLCVCNIGFQIPKVFFAVFTAFVMLCCCSFVGTKALGLDCFNNLNP